jgi:hypothetical protein
MYPTLPALNHGDQDNCEPQSDPGVEECVKTGWLFSGDAFQGQRSK